MTKPILIFGDSLAYPRAHKGQLTIETWPVLLSEMTRAFVWNMSKVGATTRHLLSLCVESNFYLSTKEPQFAATIVQVGIVDACPRPLGLSLTRALQSLPRGGTRISQAMQITKRLFGGVDKPWIPEHEFARNIRQVAELALKYSDIVIFIKIAPPTHYMIEDCPESVDSVSRYNDLIHDLTDKYSRVISCDPWHGDCADLILPDGHHLTLKGHQQVANEIWKTINEYDPPARLLIVDGSPQPSNKQKDVTKHLLSWVLPHSGAKFCGSGISSSEWNGRELAKVRSRQFSMSRLLESVFDQ